MIRMKRLLPSCEEVGGFSSKRRRWPLNVNTNSKWLEIPFMNWPITRFQSRYVRNSDGIPELRHYADGEICTRPTDYPTPKLARDFLLPCGTQIRTWKFGGFYGIQLVKPDSTFVFIPDVNVILVLEVMGEWNKKQSVSTFRLVPIPGTEWGNVVTTVETLLETNSRWITICNSFGHRVRLLYKDVEFIIMNIGPALHECFDPFKPPLCCIKAINPSIKEPVILGVMKSPVVVKGHNDDPVVPAVEKSSSGVMKERNDDPVVLEVVTSSDELKNAPNHTTVSMKEEGVVRASNDRCTIVEEEPDFHTTSTPSEVVKAISYEECADFFKTKGFMQLSGTHVASVIKINGQCGLKLQASGEYKKMGRFIFIDMTDVGSVLSMIEFWVQAVEEGGTMKPAVKTLTPQTTVCGYSVTTSMEADFDSPYVRFTNNFNVSVEINYGEAKRLLWARPVILNELKERCKKMENPIITPKSVGPEMRKQVTGCETKKEPVPEKWKIHLSHDTVLIPANWCGKSGVVIRRNYTPHPREDSVFIAWPDLEKVMKSAKTWANTAMRGDAESGLPGPMEGYVRIDSLMAITSYDGRKYVWLKLREVKRLLASGVELDKHMDEASRNN